MSATKRTRQRQATEAKAASPPPSQPASKRLKTTRSSHVPGPTGLGFLVDENARHGKQLEARLTNGLPSGKATRVDESHAVVASDTKGLDEGDGAGGSPENAIGISSGQETSSSDDDDSDDEEDQVSKQQTAALSRGGQSAHFPNGHGVDGEDDDEDEEQAVAGAEDTEMVEGGDEEIAEPSFGEMLQARHPDPVDVQSSLPNPMADRQALVPLTGDRRITAPSGTSLSTVLTQALKTNDKDLLESCFHTTDLPSIRTTIERLQSQHVAVLLQRLAERIHKRPGRTGSLLVWIQWSLVAHGGYLASQPEVMKKLKSLSQVIRERANGLQPLLHLKGKLDMLSAQLELRRNIQAASRAANADSDDDDEEGVVYVEGQGDDWSDSEAADDEVSFEPQKFARTVTKNKVQTATPRTDDSDSDEASEDNDLPDDTLQVGLEESSEDEEGLLDIEASETSNDEDDEEEDDSEEEASSDAESEEDDADTSDDESEVSDAPAPLPKSLSRKR